MSDGTRFPLIGGSGCGATLVQNNLLMTVFKTVTRIRPHPFLNLNQIHARNALFHMKGKFHILRLRQSRCSSRAQNAITFNMRDLFHASVNIALRY